MRPTKATVRGGITADIPTDLPTPTGPVAKGACNTVLVGANQASGNRFDIGRQRTFCKNLKIRFFRATYTERRRALLGGRGRWQPS